MGQKFVLVGDMGIDHDGFPRRPSLAGSGTVIMDGKPVARVGDPLEPHDKPKHPKHPRSIAQGSSTILIDGKPAALTGHAVDCGGVVIGSGSGGGWRHSWGWRRFCNGICCFYGIYRKLYCI
ncbi:hypothetical protein HSBAA_55630 [Vreelandella sulfidaeris]|uniref:Type VI secretion system PAAR protein n=1 Tax=Vreelandella sulfidaeris TaxID=115553 RepID=A0A455UF12_9GAMM|nr:hypothetical protein HSBAA_55630 [Halomonas sulfidaeris]